MPNMKDVARKAGVSLGTVSNVLNNRESVLPANRDRVLWAVKELGYRTNMSARTLKTKVANDIALIIPDIKNPFYPEFARGVEDVARKAGLTVFLCNSDRNSDKEQEYLESLMTKNVAGIIIVKPQLPVQAIAAICRDTGLIFVDMDVAVGDSYNVVNVDDISGIHMGMELLYANGHRKIAFISGLLEAPSSNNRKKAYVAFLQEKGLPAPPEYMVQGRYTWDSGYEAARALLALSTPPTAIFAANDLMAIGSIKAAQDMGLHVPGNVSVLGFDNIEFSNLCFPPLTTVDQPKYDMGVASTEMLLRRMKAKTGGECLELPLHVVQRASVARAANQKKKPAPPVEGKCR